MPIAELTNHDNFTTKDVSRDDKTLSFAVYLILSNRQKENKNCDIITIIIILNHIKLVKSEGGLIISK